MFNLNSRWLPKTPPHPACHGQRTPTNKITSTPSQTRIQPTPIQRTQATTPTTRTTNQQQNPQTTTKFIQLRAPNLPRRGRPILVKRYQQPQQSQQLEQPQRHISLKNYEILSQESYAQLLNQSQLITSQTQLSNQGHQNPIQLSSNNQPTTLILNRNQILNQTSQLQNQVSSQNCNANQTQVNCTTTQHNLNLARTEFLRNQPNQLNCTTTQPNLNRARTEFLSQSTQQRAKQILQANQLRELQIQQQKTLDQQNQETILESNTPIYQIISVPFLTRSFLPTPLMKQRESKTNGLIKLKQIIVNANGKNGQRIILCPEQENISAHLNLLNQQQQPPNSNILNTTTLQSLNKTPTNLNLTKTATTTPSTKMMGIQLSGDEFQDLNGVLQIAAAEELMAPACLDDYFIETNNISDFDTIKGTYKLQELNEMTINQMNVNYAGQQLQLLPENGQEQEQLLKEIPGEENIYNILRQPYSEELVTLTQPSIGHETTSLDSESIFTQYIDIKADSLDNNSTSSYIEVPPGSPLPTESDCISTSELHNYKYMDDNCQSIQDDELKYCVEYSPSQSIEQPPSEPQHSPVCQSNSSADEEALDLEQILKQLEAASQQQNNANLKRSSDHFGALQTKVAKKSRMNIPTTRLVTNSSYEDILTTVKVPDTPEVCDMVDSWLTEDNDASIHSLSSSPSWSGTPFAPPDFITDSFTLIEPKYENPPSIASSYVCEEPLYATPSPSNSSSSSTLYSTNPNSPAVSQYGSNNGSTRKPRGRPPKQHSDLPNPEILRTLPESERKRIEDRCKNNEASRQSRQKNKEKQMILLAEEEHEERKNEELKNRMKYLEKQHLKLKKVLYRKLGNTN